MTECVERRQSIARGEELFNTTRFDIIGLAGLTRELLLSLFLRGLRLRGLCALRLVGSQRRKSLPAVTASTCDVRPSLSRSP